jgi:hypothetical protein
MASQFAFSLNAMLDGTQQTALLRFNVDDAQIPAFLAYYRKLMTQVPPVARPQPPPPTPTDVEVFKYWVRQVMASMLGTVRGAAESKAASDAVAGLPPPIPPTEQ